MKNYVTRQTISMLARIAVLCALACLSAGFSPALAATLSRDVGVVGILAAMQSMIGPLRAIRSWLPRFDTGAPRSEESTHFPVLIGGRKVR